MLLAAVKSNDLMYYNVGNGQPYSSAATREMEAVATAVAAASLAARRRRRRALGGGGGEWKWRLVSRRST